MPVIRTIRGQRSSIAIILIACFLVASRISASALPPSTATLKDGLPTGVGSGDLADVVSPVSSTSTLGPSSDYAKEVIHLVNLERLEAGLIPCSPNPLLSTAALQHSTHMRDNGCFSHQCPGEVPSDQRACDAGFRPYGWGSCFVGEMIGAAYTGPASLVAAWLNSEPHRAILLDERFREIGAGYASGGEYGSYWTVNMGSQPDVLPVFINNGEKETDDRVVELSLTNEIISSLGGIGLATEVMLSNDPNFGGASWEPYEARKTWTLSPGTGTKTVHVRYRDAASYQVTSWATIHLNDEPVYDLQLEPGAVLFVYEIGSGLVGPDVARVAINNAAGDWPMEWQAQASWVSFFPDFGTTPGTFTVSAAAFQTSTVGTHRDMVMVSSPQTPGTTRLLTVSVIAMDEIHHVTLPLVSLTKQ